MRATAACARSAPSVGLKSNSRGLLPFGIFERSRDFSEIAGMKSGRPIIFIVDDDASVRRALRRLVRSWGWEAQAFASADEFLKAWSPGLSGCLILDVRLPGMSGLELQERLLAQGANLPIIFITAHGDHQAEVRGRQAGAIAFLYKPFDEASLREALRAALAL